MHYQRACNFILSIMSLESKDLELIERVIYKNGDDIAVSIGRSFERLEERIDGAESRTYGRLAEMEDKIEISRQEMSDLFNEIKGELRELRRQQFVAPDFAKDITSELL